MLRSLMYLVSSSIIKRLCLNCSYKLLLEKRRSLRAPFTTSSSLRHPQASCSSQATLLFNPYQVPNSTSLSDTSFQIVLLRVSLSCLKSSSLAVISLWALQSSSLASMVSNWLLPSCLSSLASVLSLLQMLSIITWYFWRTVDSSSSMLFLLTLIISIFLLKTSMSKAISLRLYLPTLTYTSHSLAFFSAIATLPQRLALWPTITYSFLWATSKAPRRFTVDNQNQYWHLLSPNTLWFNSQILPNIPSFQSTSTWILSRNSWTDFSLVRSNSLALLSQKWSILFSRIQLRAFRMPECLCVSWLSNFSSNSLILSSCLSISLWFLSHSLFASYSLPEDSLSLPRTCSFLETSEANNSFWDWYESCRLWQSLYSRACLVASSWCTPYIQLILCSNLSLRPTSSLKASSAFLKSFSRIFISSSKVSLAPLNCLICFWSLIQCSLALVSELSITFLHLWTSSRSPSTFLSLSLSISPIMVSNSPLAQYSSSIAYTFHRVLLINPFPEEAQISYRSSLKPKLYTKRDLYTLSMLKWLIPLDIKEFLSIWNRLRAGFQMLASNTSWLQYSTSKSLSHLSMLLRLRLLPW